MLSSLYVWCRGQDAASEARYCRSTNVVGHIFQTMSQTIEKVIDLRETNDFLTTARLYCSFIETTDKTDEEFLKETQRIILNIYQQAIVLPETTSEYDEDFEDKLSTEEFENILKSLNDKFGDNRYYWEIFDPTDEQDKEAVCGDLVDDLGDIYRDIKRGLITFDLGTMASRQDAIWNFKFGLEHHWGRHAISALKTIHFLLGWS